MCMEQVTFRVPEEMLEEADELVDSGVYSSRSELIRGAVRDELRHRRE